ncbi:sensor domain-containing diguanylate cyclase [Burkholderia plantarii]|nr:sensor domain-containing diguanylate cyclase [Burkholderia plantarii]
MLRVTPNPISPVTEDSSLERRMHALLDTVRHNERVLQRFQQIELRLVSATDFAAFHDTLVEALAQAFDLPFVTLWLNEDISLIREMLDSVSRSKPGARVALRGRLDPLAGAMPGEPGQAWLGSGDDLGATARAMFYGDSEMPASVAVLPLHQEHGINGYLCLGSRDAGRFTGGKATDLLERFAAFVGAGVVNVAHREQVARYGMTDMLTNLPNRRYFDSRIHDEMQRSARAKSPVACLFIDVDHFKRVNDTYGHAVGDRVLAAIGACVRKTVRHGDTVARYGGEEFVVLVRGDAVHACTVAERVRAAVAALVAVEVEGDPVSLTVSIGVAVGNVEEIADGEAGAAKRLVERADRALYVAKHGGRNCVALHRPSSEPAPAPAPDAPALPAP